MRCVKTVSPIKIEANRKNAKRSTGPRTEHGKSIARFNAVTLGLFAKHVVIPICDGYKPEKKFQILLDGLHQDFHPVGFYEEWLVVRIAQCVWRLRRATRCESGLVQQMVLGADYRHHGDDIFNLEVEIGTLANAQRQLQDSGTLTQKTYDEVAPLVEEQKRKEIQAKKDDKMVETEFDRELFLTCVKNREAVAESDSRSLKHIDGDLSHAHYESKSLLPEDDMDRVLRYEERMHRQIDWAVQRLLTSQERRKTLQPAANADSRRP